MTQLPRIHLNGTSGRVLAEEYSSAITLLEQAISGVQAITVHGRDYYTIDAQAPLAAVREHHARLEKLSGVLAELHLVYASIFEQMSERETARLINKHVDDLHASSPDYALDMERS